ncbi:MAG: RNA polymerase sigma factor [Terriglobales bacterium]
MMFTSPPSDRELVEAMRRGEETAWTALVKRYQGLVYSIPLRYGLSPEDADEVFDAVFTEFWRSLDRLEQPDRARFWLMAVARRISLTKRRAQQRLVSFAEWDDLRVQEPATGGELAGDTVLIAAERSQRMKEALAGLSARCRALMEWMFYSDPPPRYEEMASRLGVARNSLGFLRARCLKQLRLAFERAERPGGEWDLG